VPRYVSSARQAATSKLPGRFGSTGSDGDSDPGADGTVTSVQDDVAPDGNLIYPAEGSPSQANGVRRHYTPDTP
jgi:hypothetical protein